MNESLLKIKQYLLTGVSHAIPFVACGGIMIAGAIAFVPMTATGPDFSHAPTLLLIHNIGVVSFKLMLPILAGYISYAMAGKPGLVPGIIGGYLANETSAGFLGALVAGLIAGYVVNVVKKTPVPKFVRPIMPILIIPVVCSSVVGLLMFKVIGLPIADFMKFLAHWLQTMSQGNAVVLGLILGGMIAFDMGGPVNKVAFFFASGLIKEGNIAIMGAVAAAICTPPLGLGLATILRRALWTEEQREAGTAAFAMGFMGITEGAIPFAAGDPLRVIPCIMAGSMVAGAIAMVGHVGDHAPHGGPIVMMLVENKLIYCIAILAGTLVTAISVIAVKSLQKKETPA